MTIVKATRLLESLQEAKKVGVVEEPVTIAGCELVLVNLAPGPFEEAMKDAADFDDIEYMHALQLAQLSRAIVEIHGVDLRECSFVEVEVEDPKKEGAKRLVKVRCHEWVRENLLATWSREALSVGWRKFMENMAKAEKVAAEGVEFDSTLESSEDRFRRLLAEAREASADLPVPLIEVVLKENGYLLRATEEELAEVDRRAREFAEEQRQLEEKEAREAPSQEPVPEPEAPSESPVEKNWFCGQCGGQNLSESLFCGSCGAKNPAVATPVDPQAAMANRQPLNQTSAVPQPVPQAKPHQISPERRAQIEQEREMVEQIGAFGPDGRPLSGDDKKPVAELRKPQNMNSTAIMGSVDTKPQGGLNPRYKPQVPPRRT